MALRLFTGGDSYDIGSHHGIHTNGVYDAVWDIVDHVNGCNSLKIKFPDHDGQMLNAREFMKKSGVNFNNCVGCVDGMLVWCHKLSEKELEIAEVRPMKILLH